MKTNTIDKRHNKIIAVTIAMIFLLFSQCADFVEIDPPKTELTRDLVMTDDVSANAAMVAVYVYSNTSSVHFANGSWQSDVAYICGKSADEINMDSGSDGVQLFENELTPANLRITSVWNGAYVNIYQINAILEGLSTSSGVSVSMRQQLEGEAKFMRAFNYFYLGNLFDDVPLLLSTDYRVNAEASRVAVSRVYEQIILDLKDAQNLLPADYTPWNNERIRPNKAAATALLARVYLYLEDWGNAETESSKIINNTALYSIVTDLNSVFLKNNMEAIWQFYPPQSNINSQHGYTANSFYYAVPLTTSLLNVFETNDNRRISWVRNTGGINHSYKYKIGINTTWTEYTTNLRLAEQYLIRAEARAQLENISGAQADTNIIRNRAGLPDTEADTQEELLEAIKHEKRIEFFAEYGHRWMDLKRWGDVDAVLGAIKPNWQPADTLYPIPQAERNLNRNLTQNPGYPEN